MHSDIVSCFICFIVQSSCDSCACTYYFPQLKVFYGIAGSAATQTFMVFMDKFFDMQNVRSPHEFVHKRKEVLRPYESPDDERLKVCKGISIYVLSTCTA